MAKNKKEEVNVIDKFKSGSYELFCAEAEKLEGTHTFNVKELKKHSPNETGSYSLDYDLGIPCPQKGIVEIFGPEACGKTTTALEILGQGLQKGRRGCYINQEGSLTLSLLKSIRTIAPILEDDEKSKLLTVSRGDCGETALQIALLFISQFPGSILVVDSIDACVPRAILAGEIGDQTMGAHGKLMSDAVRKMVNVAYTNDCLVIFINQLRDKMTMFGSPKETPGGKAVRFYSWQRIELMKPGSDQMIKDPNGGNPIGQMIRYKIIKNKLGPGIIEGEIPLLYYNGYWREYELVQMCVKFGLLQLGGKGGGQILLPKLDNNGQPTDKTINANKIGAARRVMLDNQLFNYLHGQLMPLISKASTINPLLEESETEDET